MAMNSLISIILRTALSGARNGDARQHEWLKKRFAQLESLREARGLQSCVISKAEHEEISAYLAEKN